MVFVTLVGVDRRNSYHDRQNLLKLLRVYILTDGHHVTTGAVLCWTVLCCVLDG